MLRRPAGFCAALAVSLVTAAAASPSLAAPAIPALPKTKVAKLTLDVAGYVERRSFKDTTSDCFPGESWTQTNTFQFETSRAVNLRLTNISIPGTGKSSLQSSASRAAGTATSEGEITGYRATNHCSGTPAKLNGPPKECRKVRGRTRVMLLAADAPTGASDDDPVPLGGRRLLLQILRAGGGSQGTDCVGGGADAVTPHTGLAYVTVSDVATPSLGVDAGLDAIKVFALKPGRSLRRSIRIEGPCARVAVTAQNPPGSAPNRGSLNADGDCRISGRIVMKLRARR